jgi:hypothetical protein
MRKQEGKAVIAGKSLPKGVIAVLQSRSARACAIAFGNGAANLKTVCVPDEKVTKKVSTLNLEAWFSTPNIIDIDEMLIGI